MKKYFYLIISIHIYFTATANSQPFVNLLWEKVSNVETMTFTPNGQYLLTGGWTNYCYPYTCGQIKIWRVADSTLLRTISNMNNVGQTNDIDVYSNNVDFVTAHGSVYCAPNGGCGVDKAGQFKWNFTDNLPTNSETNQNGFTTSIDVSPDESIIASASFYNFTGEIRIYDQEFNLLRTLAGHEEGTTSLKFTPDGQYLVSGGHDGNVKIWNVETGALVRTLFHGTYFDGGWDIEVDVSPVGNYIASAGQGYNMTVKIWKLSDGTLLHTLPNNESDGYNRISFSPNGLYLGSGLTFVGSGSLGWYGKLKFWRVSDGVLAEEYMDTTGSPCCGGVRSIAFSNAGNNYFAYSLSNRLRVATTDISLVNVTPVVPLSTTVEHKIRLYQNLPNPFNPVTKIMFDIPAGLEGNAKIIIYDGLGREISTLFNKPVQAGNHEVTFDGSPFSSGIYYYKLQVNDLVEIKKMILLK